MEEKPTIKPYFEEHWSEMNDNKTMPIMPTLQLLEGLHHRLEYVLKNLTIEDLKRSYIHPQYGKEYQLNEVIALYAWHGNHHLAHITTLKKTKNWI